MFSGVLITKSDEKYPVQIKRLINAIENADCIVIGAGLSISAGSAYTGERFKKDFSDFEEKYGFHDMY